MQSVPTQAYETKTALMGDLFDDSDSAEEFHDHLDRFLQKTMMKGCISMSDVPSLNSAAVATLAGSSIAHHRKASVMEAPSASAASTPPPPAPSAPKDTWVAKMAKLGKRKGQIFYVGRIKGKKKQSFVVPPNAIIDWSDESVKEYYAAQFS